ncbi:hypothetical protein [Butyricimonas sp.]|nr:hypothetical protein [Butyricimonas sp.]
MDVGERFCFAGGWSLVGCFPEQPVYIPSSIAGHGIFNVLQSSLL